MQILLASETLLWSGEQT